MMERFRKKYRIESTRLKDWDYSSAGAYFITICTKNREHYFGEIENEKMKLSKIGEIIENEWRITNVMRPGVKMDEWIIMPNHLHGIIIIETPMVETHAMRLYGLNNLSLIVRGFKGAATKNVHAAGFHEFAWQARFYDRVIRDDNELNDVRAYILNNPAQWEMDENNLRA